MSAGVIGLVGRLRAALGPDADDAALLRAYAADRDADAFAALVRRHGPRVWAVCRRVVGDTHTAEDAFQAVFLVLARRAAGLNAAAPLSGWLHTVAVNTSLRARTAADRRRRRETPGQPDAVAPTPPEPPDERALAALDEEIARLPAKLRDAVALCELDGLSRREAAERLGVAEGTLSSRLAAARKRLAERLRGRGVGPELLAVPAAAVPAGLAEAACGLGAGVGPAPAVAALAGGTMRALLLKGLAAGAVACGLLAAGGVAQEPPAKPAEPPKAADIDDRSRLLIGLGRVTPRWYALDSTPAEPFPERFQYYETALSVSPGRRWVARVSRPTPDQPADVFGYLSYAQADGAGDDRPIALSGDAIRNATLRWSKDSTRLLVTGLRGLRLTGKTDWIVSAHVVDIPSRRVSRVPLPDRVQACDWSADGTRLLVIKSEGKEKAMRVRLAWMPVAGGPLDYITPANEFCTVGQATADGKRVVYLKLVNDDPDNPILHLVSRLLADGTETRLADSTAHAVHSSVLSPSGTQVAYPVLVQATEPGAPERAVLSFVVVGLDGRNRRTVLTHELTGQDAKSILLSRLLAWR